MTLSPTGTEGAPDHYLSILADGLKGRLEPEATELPLPA
jgi:hypothetical protein